uniref:Uncharacterized protein n=1 Tax=Plectus sambesii TaxID=2011161 RepID=A0A914X2H3_9BILA
MLSDILLFCFLGFVAVVKSQETVRQCSCDELSQCVTDLKLQGKECADDCWNHFSSITPRPADLRQCFDRKGDILENFITCFKDTINGCVATRDGPQIPPQDFESMFRQTEANVRRSSANALLSPLFAPLKKVVEATQTAFTCFKTCIHDKNPDGICMSKYGCQPLLPSEGFAKKAFMSCIKGINLKKEGGAICNCAVKAGVSDVKIYCPLMEHISKKAAAILTGNQRG